MKWIITRAGKWRGANGRLTAERARAMKYETMSAALGAAHDGDTIVDEHHGAELSPPRYHNADGTVDELREREAT